MCGWNHRRFRVVTRLLILISNRVGKGTYWRSAVFARELVKLGYKVTIMTVSPSRKSGFSVQKQDGITVVESPDLMPASGYDPWDMICRIWWLKDRAYDLIHAFECRPVVIGPALYLKRKLNIPLVLDWCDWFGRGGSVEERTNPLLRGILRPIETYFEENFRTHADGTTVINSLLGKKAIELGVPEETILYLPNAIDLPESTPVDLQRLRLELGLPVDAPILGYTGAMFRSDGMLMAESFERVYKACPGSRLLLIGYTNIEIEKWMPNAGRAVIRTGPLSHTALLQYVAACNIGWLVLKDTGANRGRFPFKIFDFMSASRPLLSTDVGDFAALIRVRGAGLVARDDPGDIARCTIKLIKDEVAQEKYGRQGRAVVEAEFAAPVMTKTLHRFYRDILGA